MKKAFIESIPFWVLGIIVTIFYIVLRDFFINGSLILKLLGHMVFVAIPILFVAAFKPFVDYYGEKHPSKIIKYIRKHVDRFLD